ncbi:MAG: NUDIX hydrolase [Bacteroidales bacterium]|nr:NUDIX hydrolase [Bacteroidales bacterium]
MYTYQYPHPAVTTDCVIFGYDLREGLSILLVQRGIDPFKGRWAFPGGFLRMDEDADTGARRELMEETGFEAESITQFGTFTAVDRDPRERVITIAYLALVRKGDVQGGDDAADARWFPVTAVPPLAFDHDRILRIALERLKEQIHFRPVGFELLPEVFTMSQLQALYEAILGVRFDRRNFASKMLKLGLLQPTGQRPADAARRVPQLYRFNLQKYDDLKQGGFRLEF